MSYLLANLQRIIVDHCSVHLRAEGYENRFPRMGMYLLYRISLGGVGKEEKGGLLSAVILFSFILMLRLKLQLCGKCRRDLK